MAKELYLTQGETLMKMSPAELHDFLGKYAVERIVDRQRKVLLDYGLEYDTWFSEKSLRDSNAYMQVVELLRVKDSPTRRTALWFKSTEFGDDKTG